MEAEEWGIGERLRHGLIVLGDGAGPAFPECGLLGHSATDDVSFGGVRLDPGGLAARVKKPGVHKKVATSLLL